MTTMLAVMQPNSIWMPRVVAFLHPGRRRGRLVLATVIGIGMLALLLPGFSHHMGQFLWFILIAPVPGLSGSTWQSSSSSAASVQRDPICYVNPLIGTINGGHVFPGATLPYGLAKAGPDTDNRADNAAGFVSDDSGILGFSHLHDSGTGGNPSLGNFPLFVHPGCPRDNYTYCVFETSRRSVQRTPNSTRASPGYFAIGLENGVHAEMTTTHSTALYRFSFPTAVNGSVAALPLDGIQQIVLGPEETPEQQLRLSPFLLLDVSDLSNMLAPNGDGVRVDADSGRMTASSSFRPSFGVGRYEAHVCVDVRGAALRETGTFTSFGGVVADPKQYIPGGRYTAKAGAWVQFEAADPQGRYGDILARVGVSFLSADQACANAEKELPDWDFDGTVQAAQAVWREKLSAITVDATGVSGDMQTVFWSGLYRSLLSPQNYTGENQKWNSSEPYYDSFYCIWDSFRVQHPLLTIVDPTAQTEMVRALIDIYKFEGKLPDCRMAFAKGYTQGGSNADIVLADAFVKKLVEDIDWTTAFEAVVSDAEVEPQSWHVEGRGSLVSYHQLGYIPWDDVDVNGTGQMTRTVSRLVEYAYDDFAISLMAEGMEAVVGAERAAADAAKYRERGKNWRQVWNAEQQDLGPPPALPDGSVRSSEMDRPPDEVVQSDFVGFVQPRLLNGSWWYQNTRRCSPGFDMHSCYLDTGQATYEGSPWLYSFFAPQDMRTLVQYMGGRETFVRRLDYFHASGIAYMGNEPTFLTVFQFHYAGRPGRSAAWTRNYIPSLFNASINGIPGNDDCAMGAFSAFVMMGFFPVAGQPVYLLTTPFFREVRLRARGRGDAGEAVIRVRNFDPALADKNIYIQRATLNGKPYTRSWIHHDLFLHGGVLELTVGPKESPTWGVAEEDLPPSYYND